MKLLAFSVRDEKVEAFLPPLFFRARGEATRVFVNAVNDPQSNLSHNIGDYVLYEIGSFDDVSGLFTAKEPERLIGGFQAKSPELQRDVPE